MSARRLRASRGRRLNCTCAASDLPRFCSSPCDSVSRPRGVPANTVRITHCAGIQPRRAHAADSPRLGLGRPDNSLQTLRILSQHLQGLRRSSSSCPATYRNIEGNGDDLQATHTTHDRCRGPCRGGPRRLGRRRGRERRQRSVLRPSKPSRRGRRGGAAQRARPGDGADRSPRRSAPRPIPHRPRTLRQASPAPGVRAIAGGRWPPQAQYGPTRPATAMAAATGRVGCRCSRVRLV